MVVESSRSEVAVGVGEDGCAAGNAVVSCFSGARGEEEGVWLTLEVFVGAEEAFSLF